MVPETNQAEDGGHVILRVQKGDMNESISRLFETDSKDKKVWLRKTLKKLKVTTYTNKAHIPFRLLNHKNFIFRRA